MPAIRLAAVLCLAGAFALQCFLAPPGSLLRASDSFVWEEAPYVAPRDSTNKFDLPLPLVSGPLPLASNLSWARSYLRLPEWSAGHIPCASPLSEVSCYEVFRAASVVRGWEQAVLANETRGAVYVDVNQQWFPDRLSMLYHGLQIAIATNRSLFVNHTKFAPLLLPKSIGNATNANATDLPGDYRFCCCELAATQSLRITGAAWPQVMYMHPIVAPFLRSHFGYHAAYFLGNWLFGAVEKPGPDCLAGDANVVESWRFRANDDVIHVNSWHGPASGCSPLSESILLTNEKGIEIKTNPYRHIQYIGTDPIDLVCSLRKMTSSKRIVQTFGSRLGFWATALQGVKGAFVNAQEAICVNLTHSQQGSLWHTWCPISKNDWHYRINWWFWVCGPNLEDARLYLDYLLW
jgi:hypothetical protein